MGIHVGPIVSITSQRSQNNRDVKPAKKSTRRSSSEGRPRAAVGDAGQEVAVIAGDGERVVDLPVAAPPVLHPESRPVDRRHLDEPVVVVPHQAPRRLHVGELREGGAAAPRHQVDRPPQWPLVVRPLLPRADVLPNQR